MDEGGVGYANDPPACPCDPRLPLGLLEIKEKTVGE